MALQWYVLRTRTGFEEKVRGNIETRVKLKGLETKIARVLIPTEKIPEIKAGKKRIRERKLFPGYVLVQMEIDDESWFLIREMEGVGDFLGMQKPIPLPQHEVDKILLDMSTQDEKPKLKIDFKKGDTVRIKEGPFENFEAVVEEVNLTKGIVKVNLTIFNRATSVEIEYWRLEHV